MATKPVKSKRWMILWAVVAAVLMAVGIERSVSYNQARLDNAGKEEQLFSAAKSTVEAEQLEQERTALQKRLEYEAGHRFMPDEMDAYRFGILINDLLEGNDVDVTSTKLIDTGGRTILEYIFQGSPPGIIQFLRGVALYEKRLDIPYLSLSTQSDGARMFAVMRITYAQVS